MLLCHTEAEDQIDQYGKIFLPVPVWDTQRQFPNNQQNHYTNKLSWITRSMCWMSWEVRLKDRFVIFVVRLGRKASLLLFASLGCKETINPCSVFFAPLNPFWPALFHFPSIYTQLSRRHRIRLPTSEHRAPTTGRIFQFRGYCHVHVQDDFLRRISKTRDWFPAVDSLDSRMIISYPFRGPRYTEMDALNPERNGSPVMVIIPWILVDAVVSNNIPVFCVDSTLQHWKCHEHCVYTLTPMLCVCVRWWTLCTLGRAVGLLWGCCGDAVGDGKALLTWKIVWYNFSLRRGMCEAPVLTEEETFPFLCKEVFKMCTWCELSF